MKNIRKIRVLISYGITLIIGLISSCASDKDPIQASDFKYLGQNELIEILTRKKVLDVEYDINEFYDTLYLFNINNDKDLKSILWINPEKYSFNKVKSIKINFGSDSVQLFGQMDYRPGKGFVDKQKIDKILDVYQNYFGKPDAILDKSTKEMTLIEDVVTELENNKLREENSKNRNTGLLNTIDIRDINNIYKYDIWELKEYKIMICTFYPYSDPLSHSGWIKYEVNNLNDLLAEKREEVRKSANLNDYIKMNLNLSPFSKSTQQYYTDRINIVGFSLGHVLPEESRDIKQFKFNLLIEDEYEDILLTINDLELSLDYPLKSPSNGMFYSKTDQFQWTVDYNRNTPTSKDFENLRLIRERKIEQGRFGDIRLKYEITAIIFDDGEVLKR